MALSIDKITAFYGKSQALFDVSLNVKRQEVVGILGRNGVGKTTTLKTITGVIPAASGTITFDDEDITHKRPFIISRMGIKLVPEHRAIFGNLTVEENLKLAQAYSGETGQKWEMEAIYEYFPVLKERSDLKGNSLSGGEQQMLATARALVASPRLLLLDEAFEGLAPIIAAELLKIIQRLKEEKMTILIVEQNLRYILNIIDRGYIMEKGQIVYEGTSEDLAKNPEILQQHLGVSQK